MKQLLAFHKIFSEFCITNVLIHSNDHRSIKIIKILKINHIQININSSILQYNNKSFIIEYA